MPAKAKRPVLTDSEMDEMNAAIVVDSRLYSKDMDASEKVSGIVLAIGSELENVPQRITLNDTENVRRVTVRYIQSCYRNGTLPSKQGLGRAMGMSRKALDDFVRRNPDNPSSEFLLVTFDAFSEMMSMASLTGCTQPIVSIFLQKALYGVHENEPEEPIVNNVLGGNYTDETAAEIALKYSELPGD